MDLAAIPERHVFTPEHPLYPERLRELHVPPPKLYAQGRLELLRAPCLAIVGSRNCTAHGAHDARQFARALSQAGLCIVSGLAHGVDAAAHRGALEGGGGSIAVLGTGIDIDYPDSNAELAQRLRTEGCVVTEFEPGTPPRPWHFPRRNRLIGALSLGVLVVEATLKSGTMSTVHAALDMGVDVFALPGSIHSTLSKGCNKLIREGAKLVETAAHVIEDLRLPPGVELAALPPEPALASRPDPSAVLQALGESPMSMDQVVFATGWPVSRVAAELSRLQVSHHVVALPGGWYQRTL
jgi:DNA processing protein